MSLSVLPNAVCQPLQTERISIGPNPMRNTLSIRFELFQRDRVKIEIYSLKGALLETIMDETKKPGAYKSVWNGYDAYGYRIFSGLYLMGLTIGNKEHKEVVRIMH